MLFVGLFVAPHFVHGQAKEDPGWKCEVSGRVVDGEGNPVSHAAIQAFPADRPIQGRIPGTQSNSEGKFRVENVLCGKNSISATKEQDGYGDRMSFLTNAGPDSHTFVNVSENKPVKGVELRLTQKSPRLIVHAMDAYSRKPIGGILVVIQHGDNPKEKMSAGCCGDDGIFNQLVPLTPFGLSVSSSNYKEWLYEASEDDRGTGLRPMLLSPDEVKEITVALEPDDLAIIKNLKDLELPRSNPDLLLQTIGLLKDLAAKKDHSVLASDDVIERLIDLLDFRKPQKKNALDPCEEFHIITDFERYPAMEALRVLAKTALPNLVKFIESEDPDSKKGARALEVIKSNFSYDNLVTAGFLRERSKLAQADDGRKRLLTIAKKLLEVQKEIVNRSKNPTIPDTSGVHLVDIVSCDS